MSVSCLECGAENREEAKFCRSCGFALARGSAAAAAPADELPPSALADTVPAALDEARPGPRTIDFDPTEAPPAPAPVPAPAPAPVPALAPAGAAPLAAPAPLAAGFGTSPAARLAQPEADGDLPEPVWASREPLPAGSGGGGRWALVIAALVCLGAAALWFGRTTRLPAVAAGSAAASA
ncbi:MAG: zinc ribbon domain-containing protein, partial [Pseudomonadota bacterium]